MKFEDEKLKRIDFSKTNGGIPLPPGAYFRYPGKKDEAQGENDPRALIDKAQLLVEFELYFLGIDLTTKRANFDAQNAWRYRSLVGYIASMKRLVEKSSNTSTSWMFTVVCKLPYKQPTDRDIVIGSPSLFSFYLLSDLDAHLVF